jgi:aspartyl-tRNA(Asn)/glutamyl-tRNA(Gln) amidotransferase subunit B
VAAALPALPAARRDRLVCLLPDASDAQRDQVLAVVEDDLDRYVIAATDAGVPAPLALARIANELAAIEDRSRLDEASVASLLALESAGELSATQAKTVLADLAASGGDPRELAKARGFEQLDSRALSGTIDELIAAHPDEWARYADGDDKLAQFFVGQVMKATRGQADGKAVIAELARRR